MANEEKPSMSLEHLSLLPLDDEPAPAVTQAEPTKGKTPKIDTRHQKDRRSLPDRRGSIRFQESRRSGKDRRPSNNPWTPGNSV